MQPAVGYAYGDGHPTWSHRYLLPRLIPLLQRLGGPVLDLGCGNGSLVGRLLNEGLDAYGVDRSPSGIAHACAAAPGRFWQADLDAVELPAPLTRIPFRTVVSTEVIEHLYEPRALLALAKRALQHAGGGSLVISTPYHGYLKNALIALSGRYDQHHTALWSGGHIKFFSRRTLGALLIGEGFQPVEFHGVGRAPYLWKSMIVVARDTSR